MNRIITQAFYILIYIIEMLIFVRIILSWINLDKDSQLIKIVYSLTEPILSPIRNLLFKLSVGKNTMFDFSPIVAMLIIYLIRTIIQRLF